MVFEVTGYNTRPMDLKILILPGDGIGVEVIPEGIRVLDAAARKLPSLPA